MKRLINKRLVLTALSAILLSAWTIGPLASVSYAQDSTSQSTSSVQIAQADDPTPTPPQEETDPNALPEPEATCESSFAGLGWILCQVTRSIYAFFDWLVQNILAERLLQIDLLDQEPTLKYVWGNFRTLANLIFVIAFLVIIYGEATGRFGPLEAYSFTRLLPRIAFSVIGVQLSFYIVGYLIALFNDFGAGAMQLVLAPLQGFSQFELAGVFSQLTDGDSFFGLAVNAGGNFVDNLAAAVIAGGIGLAGIIVMPTLLLYGVLGLALLFLVLMARKILVVVLVILAPVAFALSVLPNTEKYFKQWWDLLFRALMMYPLIMIFIGAGQLIGRLAVAGENTTLLDSIIGFTATFLPLFLIPITFRLAGSVIGGVTNALRATSQSIKGDPRDPNSMRSTLKNRQRQTYGRVINREATWKNPINNKRYGYVPRKASILWNALPGVDSSASLMQDVMKGRDSVKAVTSTGGDDFVRAMAVTGGGNLTGPRVGVWDGEKRVFVNAGEKKLGTHLAFNSDGSVMVDRNGIAIKGDGFGRADTNPDGSYRTLKRSDFYSEEVMSQVRKFSHDRGLFHASAEYAMGKADYLQDQQQVLAGIGASSWSAGEKDSIYGGVWYSTQDFHKQNKFVDTKPVFTDDPQRAVQPPKQPRYKLDGLVEHVDTKMRSYELGNQSGAFWQAINREFKPENIEQIRSQKRQDERELFDARIHNMAWKAQNFINTERRMGSLPPEQQAAYRGAQMNLNSEDGDPTGSLAAGGYLAASQTVGAAERGAREFLENYKAIYGTLPPTNGIEDGIRPIRPNPGPPPSSPPDNPQQTP